VHHPNTAGDGGSLERGGMLEIMRNGATILVDQFPPPQRAIFDLARLNGPRASPSWQPPADRVNKESQR